MIRKINIILTLFVAFFWLEGCGDKSQLKGLVPVQGVVYYNGAPLTGATVKFFPDEPSGRTATALTGADGKFILMTLNPKDGVAPGEYKITVAKYEEIPLVKEGDPDLNTEENARQKALRLREASRSKDSVKSLLPDKYSSPARSGLKASIGKTGDKNLKFELTN